VQICTTDKCSDLDRLTARDAPYVDEPDDMPPLIQVTMSVGSVTRVIITMMPDRHMLCNTLMVCLIHSNCFTC